MVSRLTAFDRALVRLRGAYGSVLVSPALQGRVFCELGGDLIQRLDAGLMEHPQPDVFNNVGGNSLWPAPEGGPYAFNYLPHSTKWVVQDGINREAVRVVARDEGWVSVEKTIRLINRKGVEVDLRFERKVERRDAPEAAATGLQSIGYVEEDTLEPAGRHHKDELLLGAWSLEQFPGGDGVTAFAKVDRPQDAINFDFYGAPVVPPSIGHSYFSIPLGGRGKFQIGIRVANKPTLVGAFDRRRSLLMLRRTARREGLYFNIADNDQPRGPWSAADLYSIFNGGELEFFELETIAPMEVAGDRVTGSRLVSETTILAGPPDALRGWLADRHGIQV
jgi:hypothetical protein